MATTSTTTTTIRKGSCLCKAIQYELTGDPFTFVLCYCDNCRKMTGAAFATNAFFKSSNVNITKGKDVIKTYDDKATTSGNTLHRSFCPECGSTLYLQSDLGDFKIMAVGALDEKVDWVPRRENEGDKRHAWIKEIEIQQKRRAVL